MQFGWDEHKNQSNIVKHGFDFADAPRVFDGPMQVTLDTRLDYGEDRFIGLGFLASRVVAVVFAEPEEEMTRIISMRKAVTHEQKQYEQYLRSLSR